MAQEKLDKLSDRLMKICDKEGKEKSPEKLAPIFHKMGQIYWKKLSKQGDSRTNKLCLIRSAALFNAAIVRQPVKKFKQSLKTFKQSLKTFCKELLETAHAKKRDADLLQVAEGVKKKVEKMREETKETLRELQNIPYKVANRERSEKEEEKIEDMKSIQDEITEKYKSIMEHISKECQGIMGECPGSCKFVVTGMGSLARCEITPYSDFEHIILLEEGVQKKENYGKILEYFRWFSVIFQVIVINLGETILPCVAIPGLENFFDANTKRGISFDSLAAHACKIPLGRMEEMDDESSTFELIKPVSEMLHFLDESEVLKNGYRLPDVLMNVCKVYGDDELYLQYSEDLEKKLETNKSFHKQQLIVQLKKDLKSFDAFESLYAVFAESQCNIKRLVYRSISLFVSALGRLNSINARSSFKIIDKLKDNGIINDDTAHHLSYAVAVSCQVRLEVYTKRGRQDDCVGGKEVYDVEDYRKQYDSLVQTVGERSMVDCFGIADNLQKALRHEVEQTEANVDFNFTLKPIDTFRMLLLFHLDSLIIDEWEWDSYSPEQAINILEDDLRILWCASYAYYNKKQYSESLELLERIEKHETKDPGLNIDMMHCKPWCLYHMGKYDDALQLIEDNEQQLNSDLERSISTASHRNYFRSNVLYISALCQYELKNYGSAIKEFTEAKTRASEVNQPDWALKELNKAECYNLIGRCLYKLGEYDSAIEEAKQSLEIGEVHNIPKTEICECYKLLGECYLKKYDCKEARRNFQTELNLRCKFVSGERQGSDKKIKAARNNIQLVKTCRHHLVTLLFYNCC
ncbi:unnamed protein product [Clavelina lepadiformis]|uniref:Protein-PII uridylyltransferase N-terminal domain-containing protein n=1 Tax=Clavelina lepadiformis TaxID=159417 RepID=A0ABP0G9E2_CLALP